jgi:hypothetical protein
MAFYLPRYKECCPSPSNVLYYRYIYGCCTHERHLTTIMLYISIYFKIYEANFDKGGNIYGIIITKRYYLLM